MNESFQGEGVDFLPVYPKTSAFLFPITLNSRPTESWNWTLSSVKPATCLGLLENRAYIDLSNWCVHRWVSTKHRLADFGLESELTLYQVGMKIIVKDLSDADRKSHFLIIKIQDYKEKILQKLHILNRNPISVLLEIKPK